MYTDNVKNRRQSGFWWRFSLTTFSKKSIFLEAHQSSGVPDLKLICPLSRHGCRMPRNNRHRKKLRFFCDDCCFHAFWGQNGHRPAKTDRFFCDDNAGTGTSSMLKHDSPRDSNHGAQHITYQHIMPSPLLPKPEGRMHNKLIIKRLSSTEKIGHKKAAPNVRTK